MKKIITCLVAMLGLTTACGQANYENVDVKGIPSQLKDSGIDVRIRHYE